MPLYDYVCSNCGNKIEEFRSIKESEKPLKCPKCGHKMNIKIGAIPVFFKAQGFSKSRIN